MLKAGVYRVTITPPIGTYMAGYGARMGPALGVHDDLCARCLVVEDESGTVAILAVDVLQLPWAFVDRLRTQVESLTGIPASHVLVSATHTHSGPDIEGRYSPSGADHALIDIWQRALAGCVHAAWRNRHGADVGVSLGSVLGIGVNRRTADGRPVDPMVGVISARGRDDPTRGVLINYTCHAVVLGSDSRYFSADYPGYAVRTVEQVEGPETIALFANGAEGDINTGHSADLSGIGAPIPGRTFERAQRLGRRLAGEVIEVLSGTPTMLTGPVAATVQTVTLPLRQVPSVSEAQAALAAAHAEVQRLESAGVAREAVTAAKIRQFHSEVNLGVAKHREVETAETLMKAELQALRIGDVAFVAVPGELFVELGLDIKSRSPFPYTFVVGLANGSIGYLPTRAAVEAGGYEAVATRFASGAGEIVRDTCLAMLGRLHGV